MKYPRTFPLENFVEEFKIANMVERHFGDVIANDLRKTIMSRVKSHWSREQLEHAISTEDKMGYYIPAQVGLWPAIIFPNG
jgi:hypothetical protein